MKATKRVEVNGFLLLAKTSSCSSGHSLHLLLSLLH